MCSICASLLTFMLFLDNPRGPIKGDVTRSNVKYGQKENIPSTWSGNTKGATAMHILTGLSIADSSSLGIRKYSPWRLTPVGDAGTEAVGPRVLETLIKKPKNHGERWHRHISQCVWSLNAFKPLKSGSLGMSPHYLWQSFSKSEKPLKLDQGGGICFLRQSFKKTVNFVKAHRMVPGT